MVVPYRHPRIVVQNDADLPCGFVLKITETRILPIHAGIGETVYLTCLSQLRSPTSFVTSKWLH